jgi:hypothetical protein
LDVGGEALLNRPQLIDLRLHEFFVLQLVVAIDGEHGELFWSWGLGYGNVFHGMNLSSELNCVSA